MITRIRFTMSVEPTTAPVASTSTASGEPPAAPAAAATPLETAAGPKSNSAKPPKNARGRPTDDPDTRWSKTLSYILRHGASKEGLKLRPDGFVRVEDLVGLSLLCSVFVHTSQNALT